MNARIIKDEKEGYRLVAEVVTTNGGVEASHIKVLGLSKSKAESIGMMRSPFKIEFDEVEDALSTQSGIDQVIKQNEEAAAKKAAEDAAAAAGGVVVEGEVVA